MMDARKIFQLSQSKLKREIQNTLMERGREIISRNGYLYSPGKLPVMLVAHLDTVHRDLPKIICTSDDGNVWMSPQGIGGDDRCGVYALLSIAEKFDVHLLFCEDEEIGAIGARNFCKSDIVPDINYIVEIDRKGSNDAVFYDCANPEFTEFVLSFGFKEELGIFSDISVIAPALGVAAVNLSSGYHNAHKTEEYVVWSELRNTIERVEKMLATETTFFEYIEDSISRWSNFDYGLHGFNSKTFTAGNTILLTEFSGVLIDKETSSTYNDLSDDLFGIAKNGDIYSLYIGNYAEKIDGVKAVDNNYREIVFDEAVAVEYEVW